MQVTPAQMFANAALPEMRLPDSQPLTLTRNFAWVVAFCVASLVTVPVVIAWTASMFLS